MKSASKHSQHKGQFVPRIALHDGDIIITTDVDDEKWMKIYEVDIKR